MRGTIFAVNVGRLSYYPAILARTDRNRSRLARVVRSMKAMDDSWGTYFELAYEFESLGNKTLPMVLRRGNGLRAAMKYARALAGD